MNHIKCIVLLLLLSITLLLPAQSRADLEKFTRAKELMGRKRYQEAIDIYEQLMNIEALRADCEPLLKEAKKKIAYISIKNDSRILAMDEMITVDCSKMDTTFFLSSNYKCKIDNYTSGIRDVKIEGNLLYISFWESNKSINDRLEIVKISAGEAPNKYERTLQIVHKKHPPFLECSSKELTSPSIGLTDYITIHTNVAWNVESHTDWCNIECDSMRIKINIAENTQVEDRSASFTIRATENSHLTITINVNQKAGLEELILSKSDLNLPADGKVEYIRVFSNDEWQVKDHPSWCRVERVVGTDSLRIECTENISGIIRDEYAKIITRSGNKIASLRIYQPSNEFIPKSLMKVVEGRDISFGFHASATYPFVVVGASGNNMASMVNYGIAGGEARPVYKSDIGFFVGVMADIRLYKNLYLKAGVDYSRISFSNIFKADVETFSTIEINESYLKGMSKNSYEERYAFHMIDVPILASYRFPIDRSSNIHIDFGPYISCGVAAYMHLSGTTDSKTMSKYAIENGVYTDNKISANLFSMHIRNDATVDLYSNTTTITETHTSGADLSHSRLVRLEDAPYNRINMGLIVGCHYEFAGLCVGINYRQMVTNMANNKFWDSERLKLLNTINKDPLNIAGYNQRFGFLSLSVSYILRYPIKK